MDTKHFLLHIIFVYYQRVATLALSMKYLTDKALYWNGYSTINYIGLQMCLKECNLQRGDVQVNKFQ